MDSNPLWVVSISSEAMDLQHASTMPNTMHGDVAMSITALMFLLESGDFR